jgi:hypothetical protein
MKSSIKHKRNFILCFTILCTLTPHLYGQSPDSESKDGLAVYFSIVGAVKYPGLKVGAEYPTIIKKIDKEKRNGRHKLLTKERFITSHLGFYYHKHYNTNIFLHAGYLLQRTNRNGWQRSFEPQVGISRTFINAPVYMVKDDGEVSKVNGAGDFYFAPAISVGFGKDFSLKNPSLPLALFGKATLFMNYPYNNFLYARGMVEIGARYRFSKLMNHSITVKNKKK